MSTLPEPTDMSPLDDVHFTVEASLIRRLRARTKRLFSGLTTATDQANEYAEKLGCNKIMVTDRVRYFLWENERGEVTSMYMNLLKLRDRHPYYEKIMGANEMLTRLLK